MAPEWKAKASLSESELDILPYFIYIYIVCLIHNSVLYINKSKRTTKGKIKTKYKKKHYMHTKLKERTKFIK